MYYLKLQSGLEEERLNLIDNGVSTPTEGILELSFHGEDHDFNKVKTLFTGIKDITVYGCIVQEDGRETDEFVSNYFDKFTSLKNIEYDLIKDVYKVTLVQPNELELRIAELEAKVKALQNN